MSKKTLIGTLAGAVAIGGMILTTAAPAEAQYRRGWGGHGGGWAGHGGGWGGHYGRGYPGGYYRRGGNAGGAIAAGIIGGLALGALAASAAPAYGYGPGYYAPPPRYYGRRVYYRPAYAGWSGYDDGWGQCRIVRRRVVDNWGYVRVRPVRICY
jgi:hypothetical protein